MTHGSQLVATSRHFHGVPYRFGAEITARTLKDALTEARSRGLDCSENVEVVCRIHGVSIPDGAYHQWRACKPISIAQAIRTPGALLFLGDGRGVGRDAITHVAWSEGDGQHTSESRSSRYGTGRFSVHHRGWSFAGLIPGVDYGPVRAQPPKVDLVAIANAIKAASRHVLGLGRANPKDAVIWCQALLNNKLEGDNIDVDGIFGPITDAQVRRFQARIARLAPGTKVDGLVGPVTWFWLTR